MRFHNDKTTSTNIRNFRNIDSFYCSESRNKKEVLSFCIREIKNGRNTLIFGECE